MKTQTILVPPPPLPPARVAAASAESPREPNRSAQHFLHDVWAEWKRIAWPAPREIGAACLVTIGLLGFFALLLSGLSFAIQTVLQTLSIS